MFIVLKRRELDVYCIILYDQYNRQSILIQDKTNGGCQVAIDGASGGIDYVHVWENGRYTLCELYGFTDTCSHELNATLGNESTIYAKDQDGLGVGGFHQIVLRYTSMRENHST